MTGIIIRPAAPDDAATIVGLIARLAGFEDASAVVSLSEATVRRDCFGPHPRLHVLLAVRGQAPCGIVTLLDTYSSWAGAPAMIVHDLFVDETARGQGLGRRLLAEAAKLAVARGCCRLDVNVLSWNGQARRFYGILGFVPQKDWRIHRLDAASLKHLAEQ